MIATIAVIAGIAKKKSSAIAASVAIIGKPLSSYCSDNDRWDRIFSISAITVIVAIIWKLRLSYASLLNKIRFNDYDT